ncbi:hypothetical protein EV702DRAFT_1266998 [Suillus placidus]|uniref:Uncharacterized protein n=1 Tax=Suillus placidus TaxID=48579 RepID=A0A9P7CZH7_9AGAM|nr:hypothetical protein EV702DRAFT_1273025 [Suillus placidus]KAG1764578.1 hypothetical protein EV702DRAFT_1272267 [Suillus placidus]KAG1772884.1 hypothetical protein EV702DRAFT_1270566 [Suillus placidus]KAG1779549.1 hypothetical protein EV702DRAFT_1266998 [Suillus placidus]
MDVIELHDNVEHPGDYTSGTPMYSDIPESLTATLFPPSDLPISAFVEFAIPSVTSTPQASLPNIQQYFCMEPPHPIPAGHALLSSLPIPTKSIIAALIRMAPEARGTGKCSVTYAHTDSPYRYPFWVIAFWDKVAKDIIPPLTKWQAACHFVEQQSRGMEPGRSVASVFQMQLSILPWEDQK